MVKTSGKYAISSRVALAVAAAIASGLGSSAATAAAPGESQDTGLEEVLVTAERREQNLQDVAIAATVFSGEDLDRRGVTELSDIQQVAPSIAINTVNRSTFVNIRGVGIAQSAPTSSSGVAFYLDGQLIPNDQFISQAFYDVGSIEVLRGPQGTLTGQNSTGGAIYIRTPRPEYNQYNATVEQTFGNFGWNRTVAAANLGFSDSVALRIAGVYDERDSFVRNIGPSPSQPGNSALKAIRANLAYRSAEERFTANLRYETFDLDTDNIPIKNRADTVSRDPFVIQEDAISYLRQRGNRTSLELRYGLTPGMDIRIQSAWQSGVTLDQADGDRTATALPQPPAANVGRVAQARTDFKTWLHEINLLSKGEGPVQWVLGAFVLDGSVPVSLLRDNRNTVNFVQSNSTIIAAAYNTSESVFGQVNWFVDPRWEVVAGLRHSTDEQRYNRIALPGPPLPAGTDRFGPPAKSDEVTGKLALNFHRSDDTLAYVSASRGYKAGGVNLTLGTPNFAPEVNNVYEVGYKTTFLDRRLRINGDVFYSDYRDIQYSSLFNALPLTQNAASGESQGAELEVTGRFGAFGFNVGVGYLDATFAEDAQIVNTITNRQERVPSGAELPFSPGLTLNAGIDYSFAMAGDATLTPRLQWSHIGSQLATPFPRVETIVPSRDVVDLRMIYEHADGWLVEAFVNNLFDETYIASQIQNATSATGGIIYGPPQQYGVRVKVGFGAR